MNFTKLTNDKEKDRRYKLAEVLLQPQTKNITHPLEGFANLARAYAGKSKMDSLDKEYEQRENSANSTLSGALSAYDRSQMGGETQLKDGGSVQWNKKTPEEADNMLASALGSNKDTAPMAAQMQFEQINQRRALSNALAQDKAMFPMELEKAKAIAQIKSQYGGADGGDTGFLMNALIKEDNGINTQIDALRAIKGGAGAYGRLDADINLGRQANFETQTGKNVSDLQYQPQIAGAKAVQTELGKSQGEALNSLADRSSTLPRLEQVVTELSDLGKTATYTMAGQAEDAVQRQLGLPVGDDAIARREYISKVDNEVLPLLRETFGAQFTVQEGESLRKTLGDVNASPEEKDAVLRSFIAQKRSGIETLQRRTGQSSKVQVTNPQTGETLMIDESDFGAASAEGFVRK